MYNNSVVGGSGVATGSALAATGINILWALLAAFAVIAAGAALMRVRPKKESDNDNV